MDKAFPGRIHQDEHFVVNGFSGKKLEQLIGLESIEKPGNPVIVYLKAEDNDWQQFFLDAGIGCWECVATMTDEKEEGFIYVDYAAQCNIQNIKINSIHCEKERNNSKIVIVLENKELIVLRCKNAEILDSDYELLIVNSFT